MKFLILKIIAGCIVLLAVVLLVLRLMTPHGQTASAPQAVHQPANDPTGMTQDTPLPSVTIPNPFPNANKN